jgi:hypothetical protein
LIPTVTPAGISTNAFAIAANCIPVTDDGAAAMHVAPHVVLVIREYVRRLDDGRNVSIVVGGIYGYNIPRTAISTGIEEALTTNILILLRRDTRRVATLE